MAPEAHEIYGVISAPEGLENALAAVRRVRVWRRASLRVSGHDGSQAVRLEADGVEFDSGPLGEVGQHLFNGTVTGTTAETTAFVRGLSQSLAAAGVIHELEVYDAAKNLVTTIKDGGETGPPNE